jgi:hypothetical protein
MTFKTTLAMGAAAFGLLGAVAGAQAAPVTYNFTSGQAVLSLIGPTGTLVNGTVPFTGTQTTFDAAVPSLTSFQFNNPGTVNLPGSGLLALTTFSLTNLNIVPGGGYTNISTSGSNPYNFLVGPVNVSGSYALSGAINQVLTPFSQNQPSFGGTITTAGAATTLQLTGITLGVFALPQGLGSATLKADITFVGAVPVPAAAPLLGSALGLAGVPFLRRRKAD